MNTLERKKRKKMPPSYFFQMSTTKWMVGCPPRYSRSLYQGTLSHERAFVFQVNFFFFALQPSNSHKGCTDNSLSLSPQAFTSLLSIHSQQVCLPPPFPLAPSQQATLFSSKLIHSLLLLFSPLSPSSHQIWGRGDFFQFFPLLNCLREIYHLS